MLLNDLAFSFLLLFDVIVFNRQYAVIIADAFVLLS